MVCVSSFSFSSRDDAVITRYSKPGDVDQLRLRAPVIEFQNRFSYLSPTPCAKQLSLPAISRIVENIVAGKDSFLRLTIVIEASIPSCPPAACCLTSMALELSITGIFYRSSSS